MESLWCNNMPRAARKKKAGSATIGQRLLRWLFRPMRLIIVAALTLSWLCWPLIESKLPQLEHRSEYTIRAQHVVITHPPRWVPDDIVEKVFERAGFDDSLSLLDPELSEKIALAFYTYPWVERLKQVRKSYPARVNVDVVYRQPVGMVEVAGGGFLPVDRHGYLLPEKDFSTSDIDRYPIIRGISTVPVGFQGQAWGDPAVTGAAQLADALTQTNSAGQSWWYALDFDKIIAPGRVAADDEIDDLQFRIRSKGGSLIIWGRTPTTEHPGELTVSKKLQRLAEYHDSYNGFDSGPVPVCIDIRDWHGTKRSLLATDDFKASRR